MVRLVSWHSSGFSQWANAEGEVTAVKDANDLLRSMPQKGLDRKEQMDLINKLLEKAPTYAESVCAWAGAQQGAAGKRRLKRAIALVARMDEMPHDEYASLAKVVGDDQRELGNLLKVFKKIEKERASGGEATYTWGECVDGWLIEYLYDQETK